MEFQKGRKTADYFAVLLFLFWVLAPIPAADSANGPGGGADLCAGCHQTESDSFSHTKHAKLAEGCGVCHENAALHAATPGKGENVVNPGKLDFRKSQAVCLRCHGDLDKDSSERFSSVESAHDDLRCEECHASHLGKKSGEADLASFRADLAVDCRACHGREADDFEDSEHGRSDLQCLDCHDVHKARTSSEAVEAEIEKCLFCHPGQELEFKDQYPHPLREEQITCAGCHDPHSDRFENMLKEEGDETCGACHADIRIEGGSHPASRNTHHPFETVKCMDCHRPHGSNFEKVLKHASSTLCSTCHESP